MAVRRTSRVGIAEERRDPGLAEARGSGSDPRVIWVPLIALVATVVKTATGFGLAMVVVGFGALAIGPAHAIPLAALLDLAVGIALVAKTRGSPRPVIWKPVAVAMAGGALLGGLAFARVDPERLTAPLGVVIMASAVLLAVAKRRRRGPLRGSMRTSVGVAAGALGGVLGGLLGPGGPPIIVAASLHYDKDAFRALLAPVFLTAAVVRTTTYAVTGMLNTTVIVAALLALAVLPAGTWVGMRLHRAATQARFDLAVTALLVMLGLRLLI